MGKVLVEKILRSCPGIERIYLLMRPAKGQSVEVRLQELIHNQVRFQNFLTSLRTFLLSLDGGET